MKCVILQPGYLPWLGFFDQMAQCDVFIVYDDVQFTRRDWRSRNRIKSTTGPHWLTVPVRNRGRRHQLITEAQVDNSHAWQRKHVETIRNAYCTAPYFRKYFDPIARIIEKGHECLLNLNMELTHLLRRELNLDPEIIYSSELSIPGKNTDRLIKICNAMGATEYLTGDAASSYINLELFEKHSIAVRYHNYQHPQYKQIHGDFIPYLSVIDLLFNCGPDSQNYFVRKDS